MFFPKFETFESVVGPQTPEDIYLRTAAQEKLGIPRASILSMSPSPISITPGALDGAASK